MTEEEHEEQNKIDKDWADIARLARKSWTTDNPWEDESNNNECPTRNQRK